jgi:transcriptional regulator with PAS, ATPase and Fis domain
MTDATEKAPVQRDRRDAADVQPFLFLVLEADRPRAGGMRIALHDLDEIVVGRGAERGIERTRLDGRRCATLRVPDRQMSQAHARITREGDGWILSDAGSTNGTQLRGAKIGRAEISDGDLIELGQTIFSFSDIATKKSSDLDASEIRAPVGLGTLDPSLASRLERLQRLAASAVPVMLLGESGTGKELLARAIHQLSHRPGLLVPVNCGAIPETLAESQLFGHMKGAFSGAVRDEKGFVRTADGGTLFLDEIGDLPAPSQAALLRVLQEGEVVPVGATRPTKVDIRVVSATHQPLDTMVEGGDFRRDLFARLAGFSHELPALRERKMDLGLLVASILADPSIPNGDSIRLHAHAARALVRYDFPLNVRELKQCLAASSVLANDGVIALEDLPQPIANAANAPWDEPESSGTSADDAALRQELVGRLKETRGNVTQVARAMGKARQQIQRWVRRFGIDPETFRDG